MYNSNCRRIVFSQQSKMHLLQRCSTWRVASIHYCNKSCRKIYQSIHSLSYPKPESLSHLKQYLNEAMFVKVRTPAAHWFPCYTSGDRLFSAISYNGDNFVSSWLVSVHQVSRRPIINGKKLHSPPPQPANTSFLEWTPK